MSLTSFAVFLLRVCFVPLCPPRAESQDGGRGSPPPRRRSPLPSSQRGPSSPESPGRAVHGGSHAPTCGRGARKLGRVRTETCRGCEAGHY